MIYKIYRKIKQKYTITNRLYTMKGEKSCASFSPFILFQLPYKAIIQHLARQTTAIAARQTLSFVR